MADKITQQQSHSNGGEMTDDLDLGKALFGDHKCFACEKPIVSGEPHIEVPADDYMREEMPELAGAGFAAMGLDATLFFCSGCIVETEEGYEAEEHDIEVPDTIPEWMT